MIWAAEERSAFSAVTERFPIEKTEGVKKKAKHGFPVDMKHNDAVWKNNFENSSVIWAFTSRWVSSCCSANSYEP